MALTVGQLVGYIELDASGLEQGVQAARRSLGELAQDVTRVTERAGAAAGQALGDGVRDGAERAATGAAQSLAGVAQAAQRVAGDASQALATGMADGGGEGGRAASREAEAGLAGVARAADAAADEASGELRSGLADGAGEGADAAVNAASARFGEIADAARRAAGQAGDAMEGPLVDGAREAGQEAGEEAGDSLARGLEAKDAALAAVAVGLAATFGAAFSSALEREGITDRMNAQLGASGEDAGRYGKAAGELWRNAIVPEVQDAADVIRATVSTGLVPPEATEAQLNRIATKVADVANISEEEFGKIAAAAATAMRTGLVKNADEAFDILTVGFQRLGPQADDLLDSVIEYGVQFQSVGLDLATAFGLADQVVKAGGRNVDLAVDAIKEFAIEAVAGSEKIRAGLEEIGLDSDAMIQKLSKGGAGAREAFTQVVQALGAMEPGVQRNALAVELFGTKAEDLGEALYAMDATTAAKSLGVLGGEADKAGAALRDNAQHSIEVFQRALQDGIVTFVGEKVIPPLIRLGEVAKAMWDALPEGMQHSIGMFGDLATVVGVSAVAFLGFSKATGAVRAGLAGMSAQAGATGAAMRGLNASMGVVGLAVTAATVFMGAFGSSAKKARMDGSAFAESLKQDAGKIGEYTKEQARAAAETLGLGKMAADAGIGMGRLIEAMTGNKAAAEEVTAAYQKYAESGHGGELATTAFKGALNEVNGALKEGKAEYDRTAQAQAAATETTKDGTAAVEDQEKAVDELSDAYDALTGQFLDHRAAQSDFEAAIDDLTESVKENGRTLDLNTEKGRANSDSIDDMVRKAYELSKATLEQTGSQDAANESLLTSRARLAEAFVQMGYTKDQAARLTQEFFRIPDDVGTDINADPRGAFAAIVDVKGQLNTIPSSKTVTINIREAVQRVQTTFGSIWADGGINPGSATVRRYADGAHVAQIAPAGAMRVWAEPETGGEAYIPLAASKRQRSTEILSQVAKDFGYQLAPASGRSYADGTAGSGAGKAAAVPQTVRIELAFSNRELVRLIREEVATRGGNVQVVLGEGR